MNKLACDLLMLGHFAVDQLIVDGVAETSSGGGVYYGAIAARRSTGRMRPVRPRMKASALRSM